MDEFTTLRAAWKAAGCPSEHLYLAMELPKAPIVPLIDGITSEMVTQAAVLCVGLPQRSYWA